MNGVEIMEIRPITYRNAKAYVNTHHRHNVASQGCKFCIALYEQDVLHGVAICGRPVARGLDDGFTLEINRLCTDGISNGCSMLYGRACRIAKLMGYKKVITYTLASEPGTSLLAANFICEGEAGGRPWTNAKRTRNDKDSPNGKKTRWVNFL